MKTLGILGGMSPESTVSYYLNINRAVNQALGGNHSAKLLLSSVNFDEIVQCQKTANWDLAGEILAKEAEQLQSIGAEGILIATNTMHKVADVVQDAITVPLLHILDVVAENIKAQKLSKVALLGTHYTMADSFILMGLPSVVLKRLFLMMWQSLRCTALFLKSYVLVKLLNNQKLTT